MTWRGVWLFCFYLGLPHEVTDYEALKIALKTVVYNLRLQHVY